MSTAYTDTKLKLTRQSDTFPFYMVLFYIFMEYARPMDFFPVLKSIKPLMIVDIVLIISLLAKGKLTKIKSPQTTFTILFILLLAAHVPFAAHAGFARKTAQGVLLYMPFFVSALVFINSFDRLKKFITLWIGLMIFLCIKGILGKGVAGSSFLFDENDFALLIDMMLPFAFFLYLYANRSKDKFIYLAAAILGVLSVIASFSRGGFVGLIAAISIIWLKSSKKMVSLLIITLLALSAYFYAGASYWKEMSTIDDTSDKTAQARILAWEAAWKMFKDHPVGVGAGNFPVRYPEYQSPEIRTNMWGFPAHSLWFTLLPELGIPGIILYGLLLFYNIRSILWLGKFKNSRDDDIRYSYYLSCAFGASLAGYFASGSFLSVLYYPHYFYITAIIVTTCRLVENRLDTTYDAEMINGTIGNKDIPYPT